MVVTGLNDVRARSNKFCSDRNWSQFHTPNNILLALAGEVGELCEIFQWKGNLDAFVLKDQTVFSNEEISHIGEEISDVIIYSTRLCDVVNIDLANIVHAKAAGKNLSSPRPLGFSWSTDFPFSNLEKYTESIVQQKSRSPRYYANKLTVYMGKLTSLFVRPEVESTSGLKAWSHEDIRDLSSIMGSIIITMGCLATSVGLELPQILSSKMDANERKYPVSKAFGSSAKYTKYQKKSEIGGVSVLSTVLVSASCLVAGVVAGAFAANKRW
jgi:dCTP diphosphatase